MSRRSDRLGGQDTSGEYLLATLPPDTDGAAWRRETQNLVDQHRLLTKPGPAGTFRDREHFRGFMVKVFQDMESHYSPFTISNAAAWLTRKIQNAATGPVYGEQLPMSLIHVTTLERWCNRWAGGWKGLCKYVQNRTLN